MRRTVARTESLIAPYGGRISRVGRTPARRRAASVERSVAATCADDWRVMSAWA